MSEKKASIHKQWQAISRGLKLWELKMIEMRNEGVGWNDIVDRLRKDFKKILGTGNIKEFNTSHLRATLSMGGRLRIPFEIYNELMATESFEEGQQIIKQAHKIAASTMLVLTSKKQLGATRLGAAKDILDRNAGKAIQAIEIRQNIEVEEMKNKLKNLFNASRIKKADKGTAKPVQNRRKPSKRKDNKGAV